MGASSDVTGLQEARVVQESDSTDKAQRTCDNELKE